MIAIAILFAFLVGALAIGAGMSAEEKAGDNKLRKRYTVWAFFFLILCIIIAYSAGVYIR